MVITKMQKKVGGCLITAIILVTVIVYYYQNNYHTVQAYNLMDGIDSKTVDKVDLDDKFINATAGFSIELLKKHINNEKNSLISPVSIYLALGMTANGADKNTLKEFENLLGKGKIDINELNKYYHTLSSDLLSTQKDSKVKIANSIWYGKDKLTVKKDFLQKNADYYNASAYQSDFNSKQTVKDINNWVNNNTDKMIDKIVDKIDENTIMYLINTVMFDSKWEEIYEENEIKSGEFTLENNTKITTQFMHSSENKFLSSESEKGFIKPYKNNKYSFVALLPNENANINDYVNSLSGEKFIDILKNKKDQRVDTALPKFKYKDEVALVEPLKSMGLKDGFDANKANFSKMGNGKGNIYIGDVLHKTFIQVDAAGTKAGAATKVEMKCGAASEPNKEKVILDRPFVYSIIDNSTNMPLFIGIIKDPTK